MNGPADVDWRPGIFSQRLFKGAAWMGVVHLPPTAICFSSFSHLELVPNSNAVKPVAVPPGRQVRDRAGDRRDQPRKAVAVEIRDHIGRASR